MSILHIYFIMYLNDNVSCCDYCQVKVLRRIMLMKDDDDDDETAYLQLVGRQSLKCQGSTRRGTGAERGAGFCTEQIPLFSPAVFSAEVP